MFWQSERRKSISFFRILSKMYGIWFLSSLPHPCPLPPLYFKMYCIGFFFFSPTPLSSTSSLFYFRIFGMVLFLLFPPCPLPPLVLSRYTALGSFFSSTPLSSTSSLFQDVRHWFSTSLCLPHSLLLFKICGSLSHIVVLTSSLFQYVRHWFTLSAILYYRTPTQQHVHLPNQRQHRPVHLAPPSF